MREMSEYTAEVLRRIDEKNAARRAARARAIKLGVPTAAAALAIAFLLPAVLRGSAGMAPQAVPQDGESPESAQVTIAPQDESDGLETVDGVSFTLSVSVTDASTGESLPFSGDAEALAALIGEIAEGGSHVDESIPELHEWDQRRLIIEITTPEGAERWLLAEGVLKNESTEVDHPLTAVQLARMNELLGRD
ncbi:MAG: hypothetical protein IKG85_02625 [Clostridia bacterium]|nr:hypothetical protein [Clostridia bacterium]